MDYLEDFRANLKLLPPNLLHTYTRMQDLDKNVEALQRKNEQCCEQEIEDIRKQVLSCNFSRFPLDTSYLRFSDQALDEQKDSIDIADRKVALANQAYDLVDSLIQILDRYMRESVELRQERMLAAAAAGKKVNGSVRARRSSKSSRGRTKTQLAADPLSIKLDFPLDPNEPKYCFCNRVSYGRMVCCDNPDCKIEWFHFDCIGLKEQPDGEWHCPDCVKVKKHRRLN